MWLNLDAREPHRATATRWPDRIEYVATGAENRVGVSAVLVRPDGVVVWASDDPDDEDGANAAVSRYFGAPRLRFS